MNLLSKLSKIKLPKCAYKAGLKLKKHAPEIMIVGGVACVVGGTVWACKRTIKASDILEKAAKELEAIVNGQKAAKASGEYSEKEARKDRTTVYSHLAVDMIKTYGGPVVVICAGLGLIIGSHKILKGRNTALMAAYSGLLTNFNEYRKRVKENLGDAEEVRIFSGAEKEDVTVVDEDGNETVIKDASVIHDYGDGHNQYSRLYTEGIGNWSNNPASNLIVLRAAQNWANDLLRARGYLFLNEVYEYLGFKRTSAGQIVGWVFDPSRDTAASFGDNVADRNPYARSFGDGIDSQGRGGDNLVDFGIYDIIYSSEGKRAFLNGEEASIWLDFNVDGVIYDLI